MPAIIKYRLSESRDLDNIKVLLYKAGLPIGDINNDEIAFIVATNEKNELIGCIGLEQPGADGLLRSLAVDPAYRGNGIGHELLYRLLGISRQSGVSDLHLLTTTAEKFFASVGFSSISRNEAPISIKATAEFTSLCPSSSIYMVMAGIQTKKANN